MRLSIQIALILSMLTSVNAFSCEGDTHQQFDFWIGEWRVIDLQTGKEAGTNSIRKELNGCVITEHYRASRSNFEGRSLNIYGRSTSTWLQTWTDNTGLLLQLDGKWRASGADNAMTLKGDRVDPRHGPVIDRITWMPLDKDHVR